MNVAALLRRRVALLLLVSAAVLLILFQLSSLSAFLSSSSASSPLSADYTRLVGELKSDASTFSPHHSITWLLALMHELADEAEIENVRATLQLLRDAGVPDDRVIVMERRTRKGESGQRDSLLAALGVHVLSLKRGSAHSSVQQYAEMLSAAFSSSAYGTPSTNLCALVPSHVRLAADLPGLFFHTARLLKVDPTLSAASASSPFPSLSLSSSWLPASITSATSSTAALLRSSDVELQLTAALPTADTALLMTAASFPTVSASLRSMSSSVSSLSAALSSLSAGHSFLSPVVSRAVSLLKPSSVRTSERLSAVEVAQAAVTWPDLARFSSIGYGYWLTSLLSSSCTLLIAPDDVMDRRGECVVLVVPATSSSDVEWHLWLSHWLGAYPMPSVERRQDAVGEWRGVVVLRYLTNLVLLVAPYSPFFSSIPPPSAAHSLSLGVQSLDCYRHPDLPYVPLYMSTRSLTPTRCLNACVHRGFQYAGIEDGNVCRCGTAAPSRTSSVSSASCSRRCSPSSSLPSWPLLSSSSSLSCGGPSAVSVYTDSAQSHVRYQREGRSASFVRGREGESCVSACQRSKAGACTDALFPLLTCGSLRAVGYKAGECVEAAQLLDEASTRELHVVAAPYVRSGSGGVVLGATRWYDCRAVPLPETGRACVCAE